MNKRIKKKLKKQSGWRKLTKERKLALKIVNAFIQYKDLNPYECLAKIKKRFPKGTMSFIRLEPTSAWDGLVRIHCKLDYIDIIQDYRCGTAFTFGYKCSHVDMTDWDRVKICGDRFKGSMDEFEELNTQKIVDNLNSQLGVLPDRDYSNWGLGPDGNPICPDYDYVMHGRCQRPVDAIDSITKACEEILGDNTIKAPVDYLGIERLIKGDE